MTISAYPNETQSLTASDLTLHFLQMSHLQTDRPFMG